MAGQGTLGAHREGHGSEQSSLGWPFLGLADDRRADTGWVLLNGPIVTPSQQETFSRLRWAGYRLAGISSYEDFPCRQPGDAMDYEGTCEVWCHCFREPDHYLAGTLPRALLSISDFTDPAVVDPARVAPDLALPQADFVYVCGTEDWQRTRKNWALAARCIPRLCQELDLRCVVVGAPGAELGPSPSVAFQPPLPWRRLLAVLASARFLFAPNVLDASPRLVAEALCLDVPVVVNRRILGGWKYVNRWTGTFFDDEHDVVAAVTQCLDRPRSPRHWFRTHHGPYLAGERLHRLIRSVDPGLGGDLLTLEPGVSFPLG